MENRPTILKFLQKIFVIYGITTLILNIFTLFFGDDAKEMSTIFSFGRDALGVKTSMEFLLATFILVFIENLFMTDAIIRKMKTTIRICLMFVSIFVAVFIGVIIKLFFQYLPLLLQLKFQRLMLFRVFVLFQGLV